MELLKRNLFFSLVSSFERSYNIFVSVPALLYHFYFFFSLLFLSLEFLRRNEETIKHLDPRKNFRRLVFFFFFFFSLLFLEAINDRTSHNTGQIKRRSSASPDETLVNILVRPFHYFYRASRRKITLSLTRRRKERCSLRSMPKFDFTLSAWVTGHFVPNPRRNLFICAFDVRGIFRLSRVSLLTIDNCRRGRRKKKEIKLHITDRSGRTLS